MKLWAVFAGWAICAASAVSAEDLRFDIFGTADCVQRADEFADRHICIGLSSTNCMDNTSFGYSTLGMSACTDKELQWWDARLNRFYKKLRALKKVQDAESDGLIGYQSQADALKQMQRAWITFRDTKCGFERSQWGGGTGGGPAMVSCLMYETAEQAMYLELQAAEF